MTFVFKELGKYGRLGNMYFQMAATIGAAKKYGDNYRFPYQNFFSSINLPGWSTGGPISDHIPTYKEPGFMYHPIPDIRTKISQNLHGYFQSERYFEHCKEEVRKVLTPKYKFDHSGVTAIHVRRTDYLAHEDCYQILNRQNYYDKAMRVVPGPYLIFSDDIDWCKKQFVGEQFSFSEEKEPIKDMAHMIGCNDFIIANSSYSWWAAYLNPNIRKKVIAPEQWFGPKLSPTHDTKDLYPEGWLKV